MIASVAVHDTYLPVVATGARSRVAITHYRASQSPAASFDRYITETADALADQTAFQTALLNDLTSSLYYTDQGSFSGAGSSTDFTGAYIDYPGALWAGLVEQLARPNESSGVATTGDIGYIPTSRAAQCHSSLQGDGSGRPRSGHRSARTAPWNPMPRRAAHA